MSFENPAFTISRRSVVGNEGGWVKMFDPPSESPPTPELLAPTNPVPEFVASVIGAPNAVANTVRMSLMHGMDIPMWDGRPVAFFLFANDDIPLTGGGIFPGPTIRVPRGVIFHGLTQSQGQPPHTIHWHGIEPTPINDGVGHCSMELGSLIEGVAGDYTYQWQPNHIGTYFYHCHRNTVQHFEFGLYGMLLIEPPDAFSGLNPGGYPRRTAANLTGFPQFPGFNSNLLESEDPHAMTVPYDVEALWVLDDRDSVWSDNMDDARAALGRVRNNPGVDDEFDVGDFHDFNPDYFFVTGFPFPAPVGGTASCGPNIVIPPEFNSGVSGMQVSINAQAGQTILIRILNAAYVVAEVTFPMDVVVIAQSGRAFGVPPFARYNEPFLLPAGAPYRLSTAQRIDVLCRPTRLINSFATARFISHRTGQILMNGQIPIFVEGEALPVGNGSISGFVLGGGRRLEGVTMTLSGAASATAITDNQGNYSFGGLVDGTYTITPSFEGFRFFPASRNVTIRGEGNVLRRVFFGIPLR